MKKLDFLRKKHPRFVYGGFETTFKEGNLRIVFDFRIEPDIKFKPEITIQNCPRRSLAHLDNLVFHLGLMEIPSYWKATCSPEIVIEAGHLTEDQIKWWKDLIIRGMGQFFYENKIDFTKPNFLKIKCGKRQSKKHAIARIIDRPILKNHYLVPVGGGKDSIVTLEKLKKRGEKINCFLVNPTKAARNVVKLAGIRDPIIVERKIDPLLLELNKKSYLNGHTPFTAVLSFLSVFCAVLFDYKNIAFSNEKSADEGNLKYLGKIVNHQYSKSSEFERKFKKYCQKYLVRNINYFSFLRKYTELEIAKMFSKYPKYFSAFSSCNKKNIKWCGKCPKCLFSYLILCPYLKEKELLKIFGENLLKKKSLQPLLKDLIGQGRHKPFECVGTQAEAKKALKLCLKSLKTKK